MTRPQVVLLRGHSANPWDLRPWELLRDRFDIRVLATGSNAFDLSGLGLPVERVRAVRDLLPRGRAGDLATLAAGDRYLGLEEHVRGADIVHAAEIGVPYSHAPALLRERLGFRLVLTVWETIPFGAAYRWRRGRRYREETLPRVDLFLAATERARRALCSRARPPSASSWPRRASTSSASARPTRRAEHVVLSPARLVWEKGHQDVLRAVAAIRRGLVARERAARARRRRGPRGVASPRASRRTSASRISSNGARLCPTARCPPFTRVRRRMVLASLPTASWEEQFGMVLAEALATGVPVLAAASGAIPEVLRGAGRSSSPATGPGSRSGWRCSRRSRPGASGTTTSSRVTRPMPRPSGSQRPTSAC